MANGVLDVDGILCSRDAQHNVQRQPQRLAETSLSEQDKAPKLENIAGVKQHCDCFVEGERELFCALRTHAETLSAFDWLAVRRQSRESCFGLLLFSMLLDGFAVDFASRRTQGTRNHRERLTLLRP